MEKGFLIVRRTTRSNEIILKLCFNIALAEKWNKIYWMDHIILDSKFLSNEEANEEIISQKFSFYSFLNEELDREYERYNSLPVGE